MPMLTARITDDEMARLKELAAIQGVSATSLIRKWIEVPPHPQGAAIDHAACDARIAELEGRPAPFPVEAYVTPAEYAAAHKTEIDALKALPFLSAPNDDCASCDHDRQSWHLGAVCQFPTGRRNICGCPAFVEVMFDD